MTNIVYGVVMNMVYMSKNKYDSKMQKIKRDNLSRQRKQMLRRERFKYWPKLRLPHTSKLVLCVAGLLCLEIIIFCQYIIITTGDTSALYSMVGVVASLMPVVLGYYSKSRAENTAGGIVYDTAMSQINAGTIPPSSEEAVG